MHGSIKHLQYIYHVHNINHQVSLVPAILILEKLKANRASEMEEQRKERLRIKREKDREPKKTTRGKEKVVKNRRPRETAPGHSQRLKRGDEKL